ncbi:tRNA (cytidine(34)-2'-O)-methyltransferase [Helicobacter typhlonius]|uniref:Putative tRNA (cytidine(34)-2'-O)-methyltransferase n=5 Tax=Helicobacter typhlonius TaxID=76936 RepID=A0A0S4PTE8_9HELI|nr:tRNA (cytidine(34)-2'-O)-methyltransferase [Helicobacter typhlonius]
MKVFKLEAQICVFAFVFWSNPQESFAMISTCFKKNLKRIKMAFHIVLIQPQIPQNTGNIGRLCVATDSILHLIHPLGFSTSQKELKRAGLDYWQHLQVYEWENLEMFWAHYEVDKHHFFFTTKAQSTHYEADMSEGGFLYFGREDAGISSDILHTYKGQTYKLPMVAGVRSINLATSVGAALYEGVRQSQCYMGF